MKRLAILTILLGVLALVGGCDDDEPSTTDTTGDETGGDLEDISTTDSRADVDDVDAPPVDDVDVRPGDGLTGDGDPPETVETDTAMDQEPDLPPIDPDAWQPPLGIPEPEFGVREETPALLSVWDGPTPGFYYVDNTHSEATDDGNELGSPAVPRESIPRNLPAGSVVAVHGGPYEGWIHIEADGSAEQPVFITAVDPEAPPVIASRVELGGSYLIVEHFDFNGADNGARVLTPSDHIAVRHSQVRNGEGGGAGLYTGRWNPEEDPATASHVVFFHNQIHDNGDWQATFDEDHHGVAVGHHAEHVWILDNVMFHNSGDGVQVNAKKAYLTPTLHHVYIGRNLAHHNKQTGFWTKQAEDVVMSQNTVHSMRPSDSSGGAGLGFQYGPERVWFLFNEVYDCENGITASTNVGDEDGVAGSGQDIYIVGNVVHNIHKSDGSEPSNDPWQFGTAIRFTDQAARKHVFHNTIYDADVGIAYARGTGAITIVDNIVSQVRGHHIHIEETDAATSGAVHHNLFDSPARVRWGDRETRDLSALATAFPDEFAGCIEDEPGFVNAGDGDFHLASGSPAVDAGVVAEVESVFENRYGISLDLDFDGLRRPAGAGTDMGAFER